MRFIPSLVLFLISFLTFSTSYANEPLSPFEVTPHALVANAIDATSGAYCEQETDGALSSIEEIAIRRFYSQDKMNTAQKRWGTSSIEWIGGSKSAQMLLITTYSIPLE